MIDENITAAKNGTCFVIQLNLNGWLDKKYFVLKKEWNFSCEKYKNSSFFQLLIKIFIFIKNFIS
jgi:hypothetical protein